MKGIFADSALLFEAEGYTLTTTTTFSMAHCKFITWVYATQNGKITHRSEPMFHEELYPEDYDIKQAVKAIHIQLIKPPKSHKQSITCPSCCGRANAKRCIICRGKGNIEI